MAKPIIYTNIHIRWEQIYSLYLATQNILLHLQHNSVVEYKIFNSPLAASPPPQRFGASLLIMKKYKIIVKDKKNWIDYAE